MPILSRIFVLLLGFLSLFSTSRLMSGAALAEGDARRQIAVVLGDSYVSGEGGRWRGNSFTGIDRQDRAGTDKAAYRTDRGWKYDRGRAYTSNSIANGCHRSRTSPITYVKSDSFFPQGFDDVVNLACSGAHTQHLWPESNGGKRLKGELPQITALGHLADDHDIKLIVVGIGGNDMGFADMIKDCVTEWAWKHWSWILKPKASCIDELRDIYIPRLGKVSLNVSKTIKLVQAEMAHHEQNDYRIVLMGAPNILPGFKGFAPKEGDRRIRNCPFIGPDAHWIGENVVPQLNAALEAVAHQEGIDFINLENAFDSHRLCEHGARRPTQHQPPTDADTEWVRYFDAEGSSMSNFIALLLKWAELSGGPDIDEATIDLIAGDQGSLSESFHPNEYGQKALGHCLRSYLSSALMGTGSYKCINGGSGSATDMHVNLRLE